MENKIQITFKNHLISLVWLFLYFCLTVIFLIYFYVKDGSDGLFVILILSIPQLLPTIYLHLKYYYINRYDICFIYEDRLEIINLTIRNTYFADDISKIVIHKSANKDGIPILTCSTYYFVKVILKKGDSIILTSLLDNRIEEKLKIIKGIAFSTVNGLSYFPDRSDMH